MKRPCGTVKIVSKKGEIPDFGIATQNGNSDANVNCT